MQIEKIIEEIKNADVLLDEIINKKNDATVHLICEYLKKFKFEFKLANFKLFYSKTYNIYTISITRKYFIDVVESDIFSDWEDNIFKIIPNILFHYIKDTDEDNLIDSQYNIVFVV